MRSGKGFLLDSRFYEAVQANPIIAAIKNDDGLRACLINDIHVVFVLYGDICSIPSIVDRLKQAGKTVLVHADLINGLSSKEISIDYLHKSTRADGIISTRPNLIRRAKELGMYTVLRIFVIDSMALSEARSLRDVRPDFMEILPGVIPMAIRSVKASTNLPVLAGGLIIDKQDVLNALDAGATAISTTNEAVWSM